MTFARRGNRAREQMVALSAFWDPYNYYSQSRVPNTTLSTAKKSTLKFDCLINRTKLFIYTPRDSKKNKRYAAWWRVFRFRSSPTSKTELGFSLTNCACKYIDYLKLVRLLCRKRWAGCYNKQVVTLACCSIILQSIYRSLSPFVDAT